MKIPHAFKLPGIPGHLEMTAEIHNERGIYFGQTLHFQPKTQAAGHILLLAVSDAFADMSVEQIAIHLGEVRALAAKDDQSLERKS